MGPALRNHRGVWVSVTLPSHGAGKGLKARPFVTGEPAQSGSGPKVRGLPCGLGPPSVRRGHQGMVPTVNIPWSPSVSGGGVGTVRANGVRDALVHVQEMLGRAWGVMPVWERPPSLSTAKTCLQPLARDRSGVGGNHPHAQKGQETCPGCTDSGAWQAFLSDGGGRAGSVPRLPGPVSLLGPCPCPSRPPLLSAGPPAVKAVVSRSGGACRECSLEGSPAGLHPV